MSGWDVLRRIRAEHHSVPVVVVSSSGRPDDVAGATSSERTAISSNATKLNGLGVSRSTARYWVELNEPPAPAMAN